MSGPPPPGGGRTGIVEGWELRHVRQQRANSGAWKGLAFVTVALVLLVIGGWYAARPILGPAVTGLFEDSPGIINWPVVSDLLAAELGDRIDAPAGESDAEVAFTIEPGQTIADIQTNLVEAGLLTDTLAFHYLVVSDRVDELIQAGIYTMSPAMSPREVVGRLAGSPDPPTPVTVLHLRPGLRIEQIAAYLQKQTEDVGLKLDPSEFLELAKNPPDALRSDFGFLRQAPAGASLEGFLGYGSYEVPVDITAEEFVRALLTEWGETSGAFVAQARKKQVDFYDALVIASLVEKEAKVDADRAKIAGVYWNRLDPRVNRQTAGLMQADPTVVYATDTMALDDIGIRRWPEYVFWDLLGLPDYSGVNVDRRLQSFQTYQEPGLPDWPIVTPTAASIRAALNPATKNGNLFFYACPGADTHKFAKTAKQHSRNINRCN